MSGTFETPASVQPKEKPEALALRGRPRPAVRFRRGLIVAATGGAAAALVAVSWLALQPPSLRNAASHVEGEEPSGASGSEAVANLPRSYGDVPRLGPPLPGDLGRPILEHRRSLGEKEAPRMALADVDRARMIAEAEQQRVEAARQAARSSPVIVQLASGGSPAKASPGKPTPVHDATVDASRPADAVTPAQQHKIAFARPGSPGDVNPHELGPAPSTWVLAAGTVIPASLVTGLDSDLPGLVIAHVTENVRDSATGRTVLVPQGARLFGSYDSAVAYGQRRALLVWTRIVFPDGSSVTLDKMPATDASGYAGLEDKVDTHGWRLLKGIALSTLLGVGTQISIGGSGSDLIRAVRESAQQNAAQAGDKITSRNLDIQPTIKVRPGWPVRALVNKDLFLRPWRG